MASSLYVLTPTARANLREAKAWSRKRWGVDLTRKYFEDLDKAANYLATHHTSLPSREHLAGGTGLGIYPVREHYLVFEPLSDGRLAIVAVIRQGRDLPDILQRNAHTIRRELNKLRPTVDEEDKE
ncbi:MAG: type II toxin-antitoxin system RelE/ParE family toxin [Spirulina sp.]